MPSTYVGRFAPSPSGPLHMGSLVCALASYLDAKSKAGRWYVRIEDIDPPREQPGASCEILDSLQKHGLLWDGPVRYQSNHSSVYLSRLAYLDGLGVSYRCNCTRKRLNTLCGYYDRHCLKHKASSEKPAAIRLNMAACVKQFPFVSPQVHFTDEIQGDFGENIENDDFVIHRKDGLFAYQLAVVSDDIDQGVTHVVRGVDLIDTTARQVYLTKILGGQVADYAHVPIIVDCAGNKLSKQNHAPAVDHKDAEKNLLDACNLMGFDTKTWQTLSIPEILMRATESWQLIKKRLYSVGAIHAITEV